MGPLVLSIVFVLTVAAGAALAKGVLALVLQLLTGGHISASRSIRVAGFVGALIAFWALLPAIIESPAASSLLALMR